MFKKHTGFLTLSIAAALYSYSVRNALFLAPVSLRRRLPNNPLSSDWSGHDQQQQSSFT